MLARRNALEAVVERHPLDYMTELLQEGYSAAILKFWKQDSRPANMDDRSLSRMSSGQSEGVGSGRITPVDTPPVMRAEAAAGGGGVAPEPIRPRG